MSNLTFQNEEKKKLNLIKFFTHFFKKISYRAKTLEVTRYDMPILVKVNFRFMKVIS